MTPKELLMAVPAVGVHALELLDAHGWEVAPKGEAAQRLDDTMGALFDPLRAENARLREALQAIVSAWRSGDDTIHNPKLWQDADEALADQPAPETSVEKADFEGGYVAGQNDMRERAARELSEQDMEIAADVVRGLSTERE